MPPAFAAHPRRGFVGADNGAVTHGLRDRPGGRQQRRLRAGQDVGDGALADHHTEQFGHHAGKALETDRLGDMQMDDQRAQAGPEGRAWLEPLWRRCCNFLAATRADAAMAVDAGDHRADRRQLDMVIGVDIGLVVGAERMGAMRTVGKCRFDGGIGVLGQRACHAWAPGAWLLAARVRQVRLLPFRGRQAGIVRGFGWSCEPCFKYCDARHQGADLLSLHLDLGMLRQTQGNEIVTGKGEKRLAVHPTP